MPDVRPDLHSSELKRFVSELHHRFNNNVQLVSSVMSLQLNKSSDFQVAAALRTAQHRFRAIAGVFGPHSSPDFSKVHFGNYMSALVQELATEYGATDDVALEVTTADLALSTDQAVALALILNELATNALKHAFPANAKGKIQVRLDYVEEVADGTAASEYVTLKVTDNGVPLPAGGDFQTAESTGFYLVRTLTVQLGATITVESGANEKTFTVKFQLDGEDSPG